MHERYRPADGRFGRTVSERRAARCAAESPVGDERDVFVEILPRKSCGNGEHFAHARPAFRSFVTDDDDVAGFNVAPLHRRHRVFFVVEYAGRSRMLHQFLRAGAPLYDRAVGREVAEQNGDTAVGRKRIFDRPNHRRISVDGVFNIFRDRLSGNRDQIGFYQSFFCKLREHRFNAARVVEFVHKRVTGRSEVTEVRSYFADIVYHVQIDRDARFVRDRRNVEHRIARTAERHIRRERVAKRSGRHHGACGDPLVKHFHNLHARPFCEGYAPPGHRGNRSVSGKPETEHFGETIHAVRRKHTRARTAAGTGALFELFELRLVDFSRSDGADGFKHIA